MDFGGLPTARLDALRRMGGLDMFEMTRKGAKELMAAEKRGGPIPEHLDFRWGPFSDGVYVFSTYSYHSACKSNASLVWLAYVPQRKPCVVASANP